MQPPCPIIGDIAWAASPITALRAAAPALPITGVDAGLHLVAGLPPGTDETGLQQQLRGAGLAVDVLHQYTVTALGRQALVCGYALLPETRAPAAAAVSPEAISCPLARGPRAGGRGCVRAAPLRLVGSRW
jgi:hypothetical protein